MLASVSPQAKAQITAVTTTSLGLSTMMQYIPTVLGSIATIVGIIASLIIAYRNKQEIKMNTEKHEAWRVERDREDEIKNLEVEKLKKELENHERD